MKNLIDRVLKRADTSFIETQMTKLKTVSLDLIDVRSAIEQMKDEVSFWVRANPFSHKEEKYQLRDLKREEDYFEKEYKSISKEVKEYLMSCLKDDPSLAMKALAGQMDISLQRLYRKMRNYGVNKNKFGGIPQVGQLEGQIKYFNELLYREYGFPPNSLVSEDIIHATFQHLVDTHKNDSRPA